MPKIGRSQRCFLFQKHPKSLCTFSKVSNTEGGPPWDAIKYAQIDYSLAPSRWKIIVQNVEALPDVQIDSDQFLVVSSIKIKLKTMMKQCRSSHFKFRTHLQNKFCILIRHCRKFVDPCRKITKILQSGYVSSIKTSYL